MEGWKAAANALLMTPALQHRAFVSFVYFVVSTSEFGSVLNGLVSRSRRLQSSRAEKGVFIVKRR